MTLPQDVTVLQSKMRAAVREHWKAFLIEGILLVILGLAAMIVPPLASLAVTIFLGWMFLISGVASLALTLWARQMPGFWWSLISAVLAVVAGIILLAQPVQGTLTLTIVVGAYFLAEGVASIMYALEHRRELSERWSWLVVAGLMDLLIAAIIITGLPGSALWVIGLLVGINLVFGGAGGDCGPYPAGAAGAGHADPDHRGRRLFPRRRCSDHHVCAGASPRIVAALAMAAGWRHHGSLDRRHHHHRIAGVGTVGRRPPGRHQFAVRRRDPDRSGARRPQFLNRRLTVISRPIWG